MELPEHATDLIEETVEPEGSGSLKDRLARRREEIADNRTFDLDLPGYDGDLYARYKLLPASKLNEIGQRIVKTMARAERGERGIAAAADTLIAACVEIRGRDNGKDVSIADEMGLEEPVKFDASLAEYLMFSEELSTPPSAREVLRQVFVNNDVAIAAHNSRLSRWMMGNGVSVDEEMMQDFG